MDGVPLSSLFIAGVAGHPLTPRCAMRLIADAAARVHAAHALGYAHRQLGPDDVTVASDGTVTVAEFPAVRSRVRACDARSEIYALGSMLWELLTLRRLPADRRFLRPPSLVRAGVPELVDYVCLHALEARPTNRFGEAGQLAEALEAQLGDPLAERAEVGRYVERMFSHDPVESVVHAAPPEPPPEPFELSLTLARLSASFARVSVTRVWSAIAIAAGVVIAGAGIAVRGAGGPAEAARAPVTPSVLSSAPPLATPTLDAPLRATSPSRQARRPQPAPPVPRSASPATLFEEGVALFVTGRLGEAKLRFLRGVTLDPQHAPSRRALGVIYQLEGETRAAVREFEHYLSLAPDAEDAEAIRARVERLRN